MSLTNALKKFKIVKKFLFAIIGVITYPGFVWVNKLRISGTENLKSLPKQNVLFVSNHQTYFADVMALLHIFSAVKWGKKNKLGVPYYLFNAFTDVYYVAAEETMRSSWLSKIFTIAGGITVKRTWNRKSTEVRRGLDPSDTRKIQRAIESSWVIQFPQGTTTPFAPGRKGTAHLIKMTRPVVVPVVIDGFSTAFDKKGLKFKKRGTLLTVRIKESMAIDYEAPVEQILDEVMTAIGQKRQ